MLSSHPIVIQMLSSSSPPLVSIGLPVFNGENYLEQAIQSILAQTLTDFELIISDNGSSDRTEILCRQYAAQDDRIRYVRNAENLGGAANFNRTVALARGKYFKWAAHDDVIAPSFLATCVAALETHPDCVLAHPWTTIMNEKGQAQQPYQRDGTLRTQSLERRERFGDLVLCQHQCYQLFGLMQTEVLRQTPLHGNYGHADGVLLARLALMGPFCEIPERLFWARSHPEQTLYRFIWSQKRPDYYGLTIWCDPAQAGRLILPKWKILTEYARAIAAVPMDRGDRWACGQILLRWARIYWKGLVRDGVVACSYPGQKLVRVCLSRFPKIGPASLPFKAIS